jgi:hypothetical protein
VAFVFFVICPALRGASRRRLVPPQADVRRRRRDKRLSLEYIASRRIVDIASRRI